MTPLHRRLIEIIKRDGPVSVERYMAMCLADPEHGYYMTRDPFGAGGDFTTAPEISQMFGEIVGVWIASAWSAMGSPAQVNVVELGPGRGTLMKDALRAMRVAPGLVEAAQLHLVEVSPKLREAQRATLAGAPAPMSLHEEIGAVPHGPMILVANEFFDALPIRQLVRGADAWRERRVDCDAGGALRFVCGESADRICGDAPPGSIRETSPTSLNVVAQVCNRLQRDAGAALIIDYGYAAREFGDTLQALRAHAFEDPLAAPGEVDLTAHVDFSALIDAARGARVATQGPATQGEFLRVMGIATRARMLAAHAAVEQKLTIAAALARLIDMSAPTSMGAMFKVVALRSPWLPPMPGFDQDHASS